MKKKKVLFVAYQFLPLSVGGSYRPYHFACYLKEHSQTIEPVVLRLSPKSYDKVYASHNLDLDAEDRAKSLGLKIYDLEADSIRPMNKLQAFLSIYFNLYKGNEKKSWEKNFSKGFTEVIEKEKIELVWVTAPPFGILELVRRAAKKMGIGYIADLRDNWSLWLSTPHANRINYWLNRRIEKRIYQDAKAVIGVTPVQLNDLKSVYPKNDNKFHWIPNSFDAELPEIKAYSKKEGELNLAYAGAFYFDPKIHRLLNTKWYLRKWHRKLFFWPRFERWIYRSPYFFFKSLALLKKKYPELKIRLELAGNYGDWLFSMIREFHLEREVIVHSYLSKVDLEKMYDRADFFLLTSVKVEGGKDYCIASKSFDYLKQQKMIVGMVCEGAQKDFLSQAGDHLILDPDQTEKAVEELARIAQSNSIEIRNHQDYLSNFKLKHTSEKLESLLLSIGQDS